MVDNQAKNALVADNFKAPRLWVTPEPGAGLIRDMPELIAADRALRLPRPRRRGRLRPRREGNRIARRPGRGQEDRRRHPEATQTEEEASQHGHDGDDGRRHDAAAARKMCRRTGRGKAEKAKRDCELKEERLKAQFAGKEGDEVDKREGEGRSAEAGGAVQGGHQGPPLGGHHRRARPQEDRENYLTALKDPTSPTRTTSSSTSSARSAARRHLVRLGRRRHQKNQDDPLQPPRGRRRARPDDVRIDALVDPLPFLKAGYWEQVHVASLVPKEKREIDKPAAALRHDGRRHDRPHRPA